MTYQIVDSSPAAKVASEKQTNSKLPFEALEVGKSFLVPIADVEEVNLRMAATRQNNKKDGKRFKVIKHGEPHNVFEVARIA